MTDYNGIPIGYVGALWSFPQVELDDWKLCNGQLLLKSEYPDLAEILGNRYDMMAQAVDGGKDFPTNMFALPYLAGPGWFNPKTGVHHQCFSYIKVR